MKNARKALAVLMMFIMAFTLFAGCEDSKESGEEGSVKFVVGTAEAEDSATGKAMIAFEKYVEENSDGVVDVQIQHNSAIGDEREMVEGILMGTVQLAVPGTTQFVSYDEKFGVFDIPFLYPTLEVNQAAWSGELYEIYKGWLEEIGYLSYGIVPVGGFRGVSNNDHEIRTPDDLEGLKIRVMESKNYVDTFKLLGAQPVTMAFSEVYTGLQQGTIDGQDNAPQYTVTMGFYDLQKYYTRLNHVHSREIYVTSKEFMESLDPEIRKVIEDGIASVMEKHGEDSIATDAAYVQEMIDAGVKVTELTPEEMEVFRERVQPLWDYYRELLGDEIFDLALSYSE